MNKKIFYLSVYSTKKYENEKRYYPLSLALKVEGIIEELVDCGYEVEIVSASLSHGIKMCKGHRDKIKAGVTLNLFTSIGRKNIFFRIIDLLLLYIQLIRFFLKNIHRGDVVIVYHTLLYVSLVRILKKIIGFKLILEFEELYADVLKSNKSKKKELALLKSADAYIFPSKIMPEKFHINSKKFVVIHGTYSVESMRNVKKDDHYIHVVYAGTLDPRKGSLEAVAAAEYLPENYWIHICGNGSEVVLENLKNAIQKVNKLGKAKVSFEGVLVGEEYIDFLQSCDIGLCTQDPTASFTDTSFPSKILSYLSNGLRVLAIDIPAIRNSDVVDILFFYQEQNAKEIANGILSIDMKSRYDGREYINELYYQSKRKLENLIIES